MASSSGNSCGSITVHVQNSGSEEDKQQQQQQLLMDQRKRKRMQSNRESARRSRIRKQKHLNDLLAQVAQLRTDNNQILSNINITTQHYLSVEADNSILRAQVMELTHRLDSLNVILNVISNNNTTSSGGCNNSCDLVFASDDNSEVFGGFSGSDHCFINNNTITDNNPINDFVHISQPNMASLGLLQY